MSIPQPAVSGRPPSPLPLAPSAESVASRYVVKEELASGGMGIVYRVLDTSTGHERALKRLKTEAASKPFLAEAFAREYQVLAGLDHPRIIRVFDYGVDQVGPFYAMELLDGKDLRHAAPLPFRDACVVLRDVATSLALLHARRLIHRDLSPGNVRMTPDGHCKLIDFGALASFGSSRHVVGTAPCIPPESLQGTPLDQRADLYALGALAYWTLTERHAYPARSMDQLPAAWTVDPPPPSSLVEGIPRELDALVLSLLSADSRARPGSAAEVIARLNAIGDLAPEGGGDAERLAQSFLLSPRFVGRAALSEQLEERVGAAVRGRGCALRVEAGAGMGRTRLLEEVGVRAQIAGACVVRVDASMYSHSHGTARALAVRVLDAVPEVARACAGRYLVALRALGRDVDARLSGTVSSRPPPPSGPPSSRTSSSRPPVSATVGDPGGGPLHAWFAEISRSKPLVIEIDNLDDADDASLGLLVGIARRASDCPLLLVVTELARHEPRTSAGLVMLRGQCVRLTLTPLSPAETFELARSLFGDAPNLARLAEWLHGRTAGSPFTRSSSCGSSRRSRSFATSTGSGLSRRAAPMPRYPPPSETRSSSASACSAPKRAAWSSV
jgi:serine/threonine-protein kinase